MTRRQVGLRRREVVEDAVLADLGGERRSGWVTAAQVFIASGDSVLCDVAIGEAVPGRPVRTSTTFNVHCATKPVVALTVARVLEEHSLEPTARVADLIDSESPSSLTVQDVVSHFAGLGEPDAFSCHLMTDGERASALMADRVLASAEPGVAEYSEVVGWHLLGEVIRTLTGSAPERVVAEGLATLGLADEIWLTHESAVAVGAQGASDVGCYHDTTTDLPLLHDRLPRFCNGPLSVGEGGFASMSGLGRWYVKVLEVMGGTARPGLPTPPYLQRWLGHDRGRHLDRRLRRRCSFAGGFMRDLRDHRFGSAPSPDAIGHSGFLGCSFGIADPREQAVVACFRSSISADPRHDVEVLRPIDVARLYAHLAP